MCVFGFVLSLLLLLLFQIRVDYEFASHTLAGIIIIICLCVLWLWWSINACIYACVCVCVMCVFVCVVSYFGWENEAVQIKNRRERAHYDYICIGKSLPKEACAAYLAASILFAFLLLLFELDSILNSRARSLTHPLSAMFLFIIIITIII